MDMNQPDGMGPETRDYLAELVGNGELYERLRRQAYRQAGDKAHKVDPSLAALETLVQAALRRDQFSGTTEQEFWAWLRTILVNQVISGLRRSECRNVSYEEAGNCERATNRAGPAEEAEKAEEISALGQALEKLRPEERDLLCLYHRSDVPRALVAQLLGISEPALRKRAERARKRLKELMGPQER